MAETTVEQRRVTLTLRYSGGLADASTLRLTEYANSITGWQQFFRLASDILIRSEIELPNNHPSEVLEIRISPEREGAFATVVEFVLFVTATEWIKKASGTTYEMFVPRLTKWLRSLASNHVSAKRDTTDVEKIAAALEATAASDGVDLEVHNPQSKPSQNLLEPLEDYDEVPLDEPKQTSKARQITEKVDE